MPAVPQSTPAPSIHTVSVESTTALSIPAESYDSTPEQTPEPAGYQGYQESLLAKAQQIVDDMSTDSDSGSEMCLEPLCPYCGHQGHQEPECPTKASRIEATTNLYLAASTQNPVKTSALIKLADTIQPALPATAALPIPRPAAVAKAKPVTRRLTEFEVVIPVKPRPYNCYGYSEAYPLQCALCSTMSRDSVFSCSCGRSQTLPNSPTPRVIRTQEPPMPAPILCGNAFSALSEESLYDSPLDLSLSVEALATAPVPRARRHCISSAGIGNVYNASASISSGPGLKQN